MQTFTYILDGIIFVALGFAVIEVYLKVNKIWKRKHEQQVAESQSLYGLGLSLFISVVWTTKYVLIGEYTSIIDNSIYLAETIAMVLIGTGMFVKSNKGLSFSKLIKKALNLERKEAAYLIKSISGKKQALEIINILNQLAWIDNEKDAKEEEMIKHFAKAWNLSFPFKDSELQKVETEFAAKLNQLRNSVSSYLDTEPDKDQTSQLQDLMHQLIIADGKTSNEEEIIFDEVKGLIFRYLNKDAKPKYFHVLIVPQDETQKDLIKQLKTDAEEIHTAGGVAYSLDRFLSYKYADSMCQSYREKNLFTIVYEI